MSDLDKKLSIEVNTIPHYIAREFILNYNANIDYVFTEYEHQKTILIGRERKLQFVKALFIKTTIKNINVILKEMHSSKVLSMNNITVEFLEGFGKKIDYIFDLYEKKSNLVGAIKELKFAKNKFIKETVENIDTLIKYINK